MEEISEQKMIELIRTEKPERVSIELYRISLPEAMIFYVVSFDGKSIGYIRYASKLSRVQFLKLLKKLRGYGVVKAKHSNSNVVVYVLRRKK